MKLAPHLSHIVANYYTFIEKTIQTIEKETVFVLCHTCKFHLAKGLILSMKKSMAALLMTILLLLSGCSLLEEATDSFDYATEATEYINNLSEFAEESSSLETDQLVARLEDLTGTIENFTNIEPPTIAENIHQELAYKSEALLEIINNIINQGEITVEQLQETEIYQTIENIISLKVQIEQLEL